MLLIGYENGHTGHREWNYFSEAYLSERVLCIFETQNFIFPVYYPPGKDKDPTRESDKSSSVIKTINHQHKVWTFLLSQHSNHSFS